LQTPQKNLQPKDELFRIAKYQLLNNWLQNQRKRQEDKKMVLQKLPAGRWFSIPALQVHF
jgi:hypothetical protein